MGIVNGTDSMRNQLCLTPKPLNQYTISLSFYYSKMEKKKHCRFLFFNTVVLNNFQLYLI